MFQWLLIKLKFHAHCWPSIHPITQHQISPVFLPYKANFASRFVLYTPQRGVMNHENGTSCCISSFWFWFRWPSSFYKAPEPHISSKIHCSCLVNMKYKAIFVRRRYDVQQRLRHHSHQAMLNMAMIDGSTHATLFGCLPNLDMCHRRSWMIHWSCLFNKKY